MSSPHDAVAAWSIISVTTIGVIVRPFRLPEAIWAVTGAIALVGFGLLPWADAFAGIRKGSDVYLFLAGMMLIAELARREGLFDWLAALAVEHAKGSSRRLFLLVYLVGTFVTVLLSNDATAIVLTPAVYAATRAAGATPLPYLLACAFVANAASFVLPISNPANIVVFGAHMPHLVEWLRLFAAPSVAAIVVTYLALRLTLARAIGAEQIETSVLRPELGYGGRLSAFGILAVGMVLTGASALDISLGLPTFLCGVATCALVLTLNRQSPLPLLAEISWSVLPLVAGLFVLVEALVRMGVIAQLTTVLRAGAASSPAATAWMVGVATALADNIANNLPVGLVAGSVAGSGELPNSVVAAVLIGVDLGPNLSITGSLATILWLVALRREGIDMTAWRFLRIGALVMPPALLASLALIGVR